MVACMFWIVDSHFHIHVSEIAPAETFDKVQILAGRMAGLVQPGFTIGSYGIDDKPVAFPSSDGVALPRRPVHQLRQRPSVGKDLPESGPGLIQNQSQSGYLDNFIGVFSVARIGRPVGRQRAPGSSFELLRVRSSKTSFAHAWKGNCLSPAFIPLAMLNRGRVDCQIPDRSGLPSAARGGRAERFGLPSADRGIPGVGYPCH